MEFNMSYKSEVSTIWLGLKTSSVVQNQTNHMSIVYLLCKITGQCLMNSETPSYIPSW